MANGHDLYHQHFCRTCNSRVTPYSKFETLTVAPTPGASGQPILLFSANSHRRDKNPDDVSRTAWCFVCEKWTDTYRETRQDVMLRYLKRAGVLFRFNGKNTVPSDRSFIRVLDQTLEERQGGGGTVTLRKKR